MLDLVELLGGLIRGIWRDEGDDVAGGAPVRRTAFGRSMYLVVALVAIFLLL